MRAVKSPASRIRILLHHSISISPNISSHPAADGRRSIFAQKHIFPFFCPFSGIPSATSLHLHPIPLHWPSFQTRSTCKPFNQHIPPFLGFSPERERMQCKTLQLGHRGKCTNFSIHICSSKFQEVFQLF